ncbi:Cyclomaltodextrinase [compost metagenome]
MGMIHLESVYHRMGQNWSYAYDETAIHIRLRTKRDDVSQVDLICGDKYGWDRTHSVYSMERLSSDNLFDYWQAAVQPPHRRLAYYFALHQDGNTIYYLEKGFLEQPPEVIYEGLFDFPILSPEDVHRPPAWVKDAVFYQIFPERFANGDPSNDPEGVLEWGGTPSPTNFFGGDLQGVLEHLDYLCTLGINAIYFNPLFTATTNHKYDTADYLRIDPHFGTNELLKELVDACHAKGIRVLLDGVFNHCGHTFPPFMDVLENGRASRYADWFHVKEWPPVVNGGIPTYDTFAFEPIMPKFNTANPEVKAYLLKVGRYWIEEIGVDGWRLDVANEVSHQFWRDFRTMVKQINPDAYLVGEIMHDSLPWLLGDQFDAVMNYQLTNMLLNFFARGQTDAGQFSRSVGALLANYPQQITEASFNLMDSHDTVRFLTHCGGDTRRLKLAFLFLMTFQGTPCIYYGDEIGMDGEYDPHNRKCMEWDPLKQNQDLLEYYRWAIRLRKSNSAFRSSAIKFMEHPEHPALLVYERRDEHHRFLVIMNNSEFPMDAQVSALKSESVWINQELQQPADIGERGELHLPAYGYVILREA